MNYQLAVLVYRFACLLAGYTVHVVGPDHIATHKARSFMDCAAWARCYDLTHTVWVRRYGFVVATSQGVFA